MYTRNRGNDLDIHGGEGECWSGGAEDTKILRAYSSTRPRPIIRDPRGSKGVGPCGRSEIYGKLKLKQLNIYYKARSRIRIVNKIL